MADVSQAQLVNQMSALIQSWQLYIDQQRALDNGTADYSTATPPGQPALGWYPITDPAGIVGWRPCVARMVSDAAGMNSQQVQLNFTAGFTGSNSQYTLQAKDNGWVYFLNGSTSSTSVTITVPTGLGRGFHCTIIQAGTGQIKFVAASGVSLGARQGFDTTAGQDGIATLMAVSRTSSGVNTYRLFGDLKVGN